MARSTLGRLRRFVRSALDELEGNARPAPALLNHFVAALPAAPLAPANGDDAVDGDEGELLIAQTAALHLVEPGPAAEADAIVPTADEEEIDGGQDNVDFPCTLCGQTLRGGSHGSRLDFAFRVDCKTHAKCRKYRSYKVGLQKIGHFARLYYLGAWLCKDGMAAAQHRRCNPSAADVLCVPDAARLLRES